MEPIMPVAERILQTLSLESAEELEREVTDAFTCNKCRDTGLFDETRIRNGFEIKGVRKCDCILQSIADSRIAAMPAEYKNCSLTNLSADLTKHPDQPEIIRKIKTNPAGNYIFAGDYRVGKSHFFWCLFREAVNSYKKVYAGTLRSLITDYQKAIELSQAKEPFTLPITAEELRQNNTRYSLFLDDLDKARATEYVAEQLFELIDAANSYNHQIVVTTNLSPNELLEHFKGADKFGRFGGAIIGRLLEACEEIEMF